MGVDVESLVTIIILWGIPTGIVVWRYIYMSDEDRKSAMKELRSWQFMSTIGLLTVGVLLLTTWSLWNHHILVVLGLSSLSLSAFFIVLRTWGKSKISSIVLIVLMSGLIMMYLSELTVFR